jgi:hypothetical protein
VNRTAHCACGGVSITLAGEPDYHALCHCTNCKRRTGSAFGISAYFKKGAVVEKKGETKAYAFHNKLQDHDQERHFCPTCGSTLYWYNSTYPDLVGIAGGCFADADLDSPTMSVTHAKKLPWLHLPDGMKLVQK